MRRLRSLKHFALSAILKAIANKGLYTIILTIWNCFVSNCKHWYYNNCAVRPFNACINVIRYSTH